MCVRCLCQCAPPPPLHTQKAHRFPSEHLNGSSHARLFWWPAHARCPEKTRQTVRPAAHVTRTQAERPSPARREDVVVPVKVTSDVNVCVCVCVPCIIHVCKWCKTYPKLQIRTQPFQTVHRTQFKHTAANISPGACFAYASS